MLCKSPILFPLKSTNSIICFAINSSVLDEEKYSPFGYCDSGEVKYCHLNPNILNSGMLNERSSTICSPLLYV